MKMNRILDSARFVIENSDFVKINKERVVQFSAGFDHGKAEHWLSAAPFDFSNLTEDEKLHFLFIFNSLSFSYWGEPKWTVHYKDMQYDGAWGLIVALDKAIKNGTKLLDFKFCSKISLDEFKRILEANVEIPLLKERWKILHEIGENMANKYGGRVRNLINEANNDAPKLLDLILQNFSSFQDTAVYKGKEVYFQKRAQLFVADVFQIFDGEGFGMLNKVDTITACADYKLPQVLRKLGVFEYEPSLSEKIDGKIELIHNSPEEVEIRANTIWAVEFIKEEVKKHSPDIMSFEINDHLWLATQEKFPDDKPYHRTRTTAY
ncbi:MAG: queuosine salvage family protein [Candidatus Staskawiczbacteria bacterium]|jgi:hypothetical protein